jgi:hypothetical protein
VWNFTPAVKLALLWLGGTAEAAAAALGAAAAARTFDKALQN